MLEQTIRHEGRIAALENEGEHFATKEDLTKLESKLIARVNWGLVILVVTIAGALARWWFTGDSGNSTFTEPRP